MSCLASLKTAREISASHKRVTKLAHIVPLSSPPTPVLPIPPSPLSLATTNQDVNELLDLPIYGTRAVTHRPDDRIECPH